MGVRTFTASSSMCFSVALLALLRVSPNRHSDGRSFIQTAFRAEGPHDSDQKLSKSSGHKDGAITEVEKGAFHINDFSKVDKGEHHKGEHTNEHSAKVEKGAFHIDNEHTNEHSACTDLVNHGTHFTVEIEVGTPMAGMPSQKFDVVADTGSDAIIVPSCACVNAGHCSKTSRCFTGTNKSSTFALSQNGPEGPASISMMFGSGPVQAVIASDTVRVGNLRTVMKDGVMLMTNQKLNIKGQFEGILGLGLPGAEAKKNLYSQGQSSKSSAQQPDSAHASEAAIQKALKGSGLDLKDLPSEIADALKTESGLGSEIADALKSAAAASGEQAWVVNAQVLEPEEMPAMSPLSFLEKRKPASAAQAKETIKASAHTNTTHERPETTSDKGVLVKGFLEEAGIKRFSMCFNDGSNGVLRLGTPKVETAHGSVGQVHWGLDFRGISVGNVSAPVLFCDSKNMTEGQKTPCGAIPDSGTTALMAPAEHLISLYESLCDGWDRCKKNFTAMEEAAENAHKAAEKAYNVDPFDIQAASKATIFQTLILNCKEWLTDDEGLDELPPIHFHVRGSNGSKQALQLKGWSYIIETQEKEFDLVYKDIPGIGKLPTGKNFTGKTNKVCSPAFSPMEYNTKENGPVWILGTPVFYEYQVGYDMESKPPAISFANVPCGSCEGNTAKADRTASFMSKSAATTRGQARRPRQVNGPFRKPNLDFAQPL